jgi:hypothetical protein
MNKTYGSWQQAKQLLDNMSEPNINFGNDKKHLDVYRPDVLGYQCQYVKNKTKKGIKSWLVITNHENNCVYIKNFSEVSEEEVNKIFNS